MVDPQSLGSHVTLSATPGFELVLKSERALELSAWTLWLQRLGAVEADPSFTLQLWTYFFGLESLSCHFFSKIDLFILCMCIHVVIFTYQKRASDTILDGCEPPCGCWELNSGPLVLNSWAISPALSPLQLRFSWGEAAFKWQLKGVWRCTCNSSIRKPRQDDCEFEELRLPMTALGDRILNDEQN